MNTNNIKYNLTRALVEGNIFSAQIALEDIAKAMGLYNRDTSKEVSREVRYWAMEYSVAQQATLLEVLESEDAEERKALLAAMAKRFERFGKLQPLVAAAGGWLGDAEKFGPAPFRLVHFPVRNFAGEATEYSPHGETPDVALAELRAQLNTLRAEGALPALRGDLRRLSGVGARDWKAWASTVLGLAAEYEVELAELATRDSKAAVKAQAYLAEPTSGKLAWAALKGLAMSLAGRAASAVYFAALKAPKSEADATAVAIEQGRMRAPNGLVSGDGADEAPREEYQDSTGEWAVEARAAAAALETADALVRAMLPLSNGGVWLSPEVTVTGHAGEICPMLMVGLASPTNTNGRAPAVLTEFARYCEIKAAEKAAEYRAKRMTNAAVNTAKVLEAASKLDLS